MGKGSLSIKSQIISAHNGEFTDPFEPCPKFNIKPLYTPVKADDLCCKSKGDMI